MASCICQIISSLLMLILLLFSCTGHSQALELECIPSIKVPRNTTWKSPEKETLLINCTVITESHCWKNLSMSWCKIENSDHCRSLSHSNHTVVGWRTITENKRMFFLIFWRLSVQDAGPYRCRSDEPVISASHTINVTVTAVNLDSDIVSNENKITTVNPDTEDETTYMTDTEQSTVQQFYVVYSIVLVVILVLSVLALFKTIYNKDSKKPLEDEDLLTAVCYKAAEDSSLQD